MTPYWTRRGASWFLLAGILLIAGVVRFAAYPSTMMTNADGATRTWIALDWLDDPHVIAADQWGPGYTYFLAPVIALAGDAFVIPIYVAIILSLATAVVLYCVTQELFGDVRASLFVAAAYTLYPIAMSSSYINMPETPSNFLLALSFLFAVRARGPKGNARDAALAGLFLTLAGSMRFEVWAYIPLFGLLLFNRFRFMLIFGFFAMLFPTYWMISCAIEEGDPLFSMSQSSEWILDVEGGNEGVDTAELVKRVVYFPAVAFLGSAPLVGLLIAAGIALTLYRRKPQALWLIPPVALALLMEVNTIRGLLETQPRFALPYMVLLFPFMALAVVELLKRKWGVAAALVILITNVPLSYLGNYGTPDKIREMYESAINAFPVVSDTDNAALRDMSKTLNAALDRAAQEGGEPVVVSDFYGWSETYFVVYDTHLKPGRVFVAPGADNDSIDEPKVERVLGSGESGVLIVLVGDRFAEAIGFEPGVDRVVLNEHTLRLGALLDRWVIDDMELEMYPFTQEIAP